MLCCESYVASALGAAIILRYFLRPTENRFIGPVGVRLLDVACGA